VRTVAVILVAVAPLASLGCSSGSDSSAPVTAADSTAAPVTPPVSLAGSVPASSVALPATDQDRCEDTPDPAEYPPDDLPVALRPCDIPSDLRVTPIREGAGRAAEEGDTLIVDYTGVLSETGALFDTTYQRDLPFDFVLGRGGVIAGWDEGLIGTSPGDVVKLDVPANLAYGANPPTNDIPPDAALTFVIEVRAVVAPTAAEGAPLDLLTTPSTGATVLGVVDNVVGEGPVVEAGDTAIVHMLLARGDNLEVVLNTWEQSDPLQVVIAEGQSLPGLIEGLQGATVGTRRVITIPPDQAFGPQGDPGLGLPAGVDVVVVAEIVGVY
jgi:peptidylprolyl isomerase